jgi:hypothetical protein
MNKMMVFITILFAVILFVGCRNKDFKTEPDSGGINIKEYTGSEANVIIPEKINGKLVYGISGYLTKDGEYIGAFENNQFIKSVTVPDNWTFTIYENAFRNCTSLETIKLPYSINSINEEAFKNCTSLLSIEIPEAPPDSSYSLYIHREAFANCIALEQVSLPVNRNNFDIDSTAFIGCDKIKYPSGNSRLDDILNPPPIKPVDYLAKNLALLLESRNTRYTLRQSEENTVLENYSIKENGVLPKLSDDFASNPKGKIFFLQRQDWGGTNLENIIFAKFGHLNYLLKNISEEDIDKYIPKDISEVEYIVLFSNYLGEKYLYRSGNETGYNYTSTLKTEVYKADGITGSFKLIRTLKTVTSTPEATATSVSISGDARAFGIVFGNPPLPLVMESLEYIKNLK